MTSSPHFPDLHPNRQYTRWPITLADLDEDVRRVKDKWHFVGIDLAPSETLESGIVVLDRSRQLLRMDKLATNEDILRFITCLGPARDLIVTLNIPKNLSVAGRFRQEEIRMHPLRLTRPEGGETLDRTARRTRPLYQALCDTGVLCLLSYNYQTRMNYDMETPFRARSPQACRMLQSMIKTHLEIGNLPANLVPVSVLDALVAAYVSWTVYAGSENQHYRLLTDHQQHWHVEALARLAKVRRSRRR